MKKRNILKFISAVVLASFMLTACSENTTSGTQSSDSTVDSSVTDSSTAENSSDEKQPQGYQYDHELNIIDDNYRNYYEIFVYSFCDSDGDGIGDLNGVISKLDYVADMGFNGIWLMPISQSTTYHKYDVVDYCSIDKQYGTMEDFERLVEECHKRGIKLILDMVINHSSDEHEWFKSAKASLKVPECSAAEDEECASETLCPKHNKYVGYYNFVKEKPNAAGYNKLSSTDYYYECMFWGKMPDLNLANEDLRRDLEGIVDFWFDKGADGFRLDAAKEYYSGSPEKNTEVLNWFTSYCKSKKPDCYLVAEVWESFSTYTKYYQSGIDSVFGFTMAQQEGKIAKTITQSGMDNSAQSFAQAMVTVQNTLKKNNENAIDAPFIGNHDTARMSGFLRNDPTYIKAATGLLLTMGGSPFVYYGDEIGMAGSGKDENKRAPMIWSSTDTTGITNGPKDMEPQENKFPSVEEQLADENSILNYHKRALRIRNENPCIARGTTTYIATTDMDIGAVKKEWNDESLTIVYNISDTEKVVSDEALNLGEMQIWGYLTTEVTQEVTLDGGSATMPPYSILFLKAK